MDVEALLARLQVLEDREAIRELKARYCDICDDGHDPDRIAEIFAPDGVWESERHGRFVGPEEIKAQFRRFGRDIAFSQHMVTNPVITVDGDTATGRWYFLSPMEFRGRPRWSFVRYDERYVRLSGTWLYQHLHVSLRLDAPHVGGWSDATASASAPAPAS